MDFMNQYTFNSTYQSPPIDYTPTDYLAIKYDIGLTCWKGKITANMPIWSH